MQKTLTSIPLYYWAGHKNLGDELSKYIVEKISGKTVSYVEETWPEKLLAIGSVINWKTAYSQSDIWGSGCLKRKSLRPGSFFKRMLHKMSGATRKSRIHATRGPITQELLIQHGFDAPPVFGDPAILLPRFYMPSSDCFGCDGKIGLIFHHNIPNSFEEAIPEGFKLISIFREGALEIEDFVDEVVSCKAVYTVSLHGLIVAQSYGIPASWIQIKNHAIHDDAELKFYDYFLGAGQVKQEPIIINNPSELKGYKDSFYAVKPFHNADALLQAFPSRYL